MPEVIKREAGDKTKGFTLQKQRALALFFDEVKSNSNTHVNVAIEYKGDVYLQNDTAGYIEEQKNYDEGKAFSFNSPQILNTLVYFLEIWLREGKSQNLRFGFYSTSKVTKENNTEKVKNLEITLPSEGVLKLVVERNFSKHNLLDSIKKYLIAEYKDQYDEDISDNLDDVSLITFLNAIKWYFEQDNEKEYKYEVIKKIKDSKFASYLTTEFQPEFVYAALMLALEEKQDEIDNILKFLSKDNVENIFLRVSTGHQINSKAHKYLNIDSQNIKPRNSVLKFLTPHKVIIPDIFISRDKELNEIEQKLKTHKRPLLLINGEGGIGKTSIAHAYWDRNADKYTHLAYLSGEGSLVSAFGNILFHLLPNEINETSPTISHFDYTLNLLQNLPSKSLLLIDNANNYDDLSNFLARIRGLNWHVLITTRCIGISDNEYKVEHLPAEKAKKLFKNFYNEKNSSFEKSLDNFLHLINYNTLVLELYAKFLRECSETGETLQSILTKLEDRGIILDGEEIYLKVDWTEQSSYSGDKKLDSILDALYDFNLLDEESKTLLLNLSLLGITTISLEDLKQILNWHEVKTLRSHLNKLSNSGWISTTGTGSEKRYKLSPVVRMLTLEKNKSIISKGFLSDLCESLTDLLYFQYETLDYKGKLKWVPYADHLGQIKDAHHPSELIQLLNSQVCILRAHKDKDNLKACQLLLGKAMDEVTKHFDQSSIEFYDTHTNYSLVEMDIGGDDNLRKAESVLRMLFENERKSLGTSSNRYLKIIANLTAVFTTQRNIKNTAEGINLIKSILSTPSHSGITNSKDALVLKSNLAILLMNLGDRGSLEEAKNLLEECLQDLKEASFIDLYAVDKTELNLAAVYMMLGGTQNLDSAEKLLLSTIDYSESKHGAESLQVGKRKFNLSNVYNALGGESNINLALDMMRKVLTIYINFYGEQNLEVASVKAAIAGFLIQKNENLKKAQILLEESLQVYSNWIDSKRPEVISTKRLLCFLFLKLDMDFEIISQHLKETYRAFRINKYKMDLKEDELLDLALKIYSKGRNVPIVDIRNNPTKYREFVQWLSS